MRRLLFASWLTLVAGPAAVAGVEKLEDWELVCGSPANDCRLIQTHLTASGKAVFAATIVRSKKPEGVVALFSVPKGVYLAPGMEMTIEKAPPFKVLYEVCDDTGCHGGFAIAGKIADSLKGKATSARVVFFDDLQKPVTINLSLRGLAAGLDRLRKMK
jgi:invasion protein IalB